MPNAPGTTPRIIVRRSENKILTLVLVFVFLAAPATLSAVWFKYTGRAAPLAITREQQALQGLENGVAIIAIVDLGTSGTRNPQDVRRLLQSGFSRHGEDVVVTFTSSGNAAATVIYRVGSNEFGPLPLGSAGQNIRMAVDAYRMH